MDAALSSRIGLIAGNGGFPIEFIKNAKENGVDVVVIAHKGETEPEVEKIASQCTWVKVGQLGKVIDTLVRSGVQQVAFLGGIRRPRIMQCALDMRALSVLAKARSLRDDAILRAISAEIESKGISVISPSIFLHRCLARPGLFSSRPLTAKESADARLGWVAAKHLGTIDVGQTVVVREGVILAVEAVEGTDAAIRRVKDLAPPGSVVVKTSKPIQDMRLDLPAIGPTTIDSMTLSGCSALVIESERAYVLDPSIVGEKARGKGIAIKVVASVDDLTTHG